MQRAAFACIIIVLLSGCGTVYNSGISGAHTPTHIFTSKINPDLVMAQMDISNAVYFNENETNFILRNHFLKCRRGKFGSLNTGIMIYGGIYEVAGIDTDKNRSYEYFGIGPEFSGTIFLPLGNLKLGYGLHCYVVIEQGAYYNFLRDNDLEKVAHIINPLITSFNFIGYDLSDDETIILQAAANNYCPTLSIAHLQNDFSISASWSPIHKKGNNIYDFGSFSFGIIQKF